MTEAPSTALDWICRRTGASAARRLEHIQSLWSGYGEIVRVGLTGAEWPTVILKRVDPPTTGRHPRGWNTDLSHERKLRSYDVERTFYEHFAGRCDEAVRVAACLGTTACDGTWWMLFEDLDAAGFDGRRGGLSDDELDACLSWLAEFHATFLGVAPEGLWEVGTYWHLATRPDELARTNDAELRTAAAALDARLNDARFQTFVHGDAKVANFCFSSDARVAAVDFQYVGGGCGVKDVAYFLGSCLSDDDCERHVPRLLDRYFDLLRAAVARRQPSVDVDALEAEWRALFPVAWADFDRFLAGWAPGHWKRGGYSRRLTRSVLDELR